MEQTKLAIATICLARDAEEEQRLRQSIVALTALGFPVFVTDGGSPEGFIEFLHNQQGIHLLPTAKGLWPQALNSLLHAYESGSPLVLYTEPDKYELFANHLPGILQDQMPDGQSGITMLSRSGKAFSSFPPFQQMTETTINESCAVLTRKRIDHTYGPFILNRTIIPMLKDLPEDIGWGWRPYAFIRAVQSGYSIEGIEGDFFCPEEQQTDDADERVYRMKQLKQNMEGIIRAAAFGTASGK